MSTTHSAPTASAADPATPTETPTTTPTLADWLTQMSDDIRAEMESCGRGPAGQVERAWLGLMLLLYRFLAELAGRPVPAWMDEADIDESWADSRRARRAAASDRVEQNPAVTAMWPDDALADGWDDDGPASPMVPATAAETVPAELHSTTQAAAASPRVEPMTREPSHDSAARRAPSRRGHARCHVRHASPARVWSATVLSLRK